MTNLQDNDFANEIQPNLPTEDIENDHMFLISVVRDRSGSMNQDDIPSAMQKSTAEFIESIQKSKSDDEILVSLTEFDDQIDSYGFRNVADLPTHFQPRGTTDLYGAIVTAQKRLYDGNGNGYMEQLIASGVRTRGALVIWSDGKQYMPSRGKSEEEAILYDAKEGIKLLKNNEILVAIVAFGDKARGIGQDIGITPQNILETSATAGDLRKIWGILSKSAISQSKTTAAGATASQGFFTV